MQRIYADLHIHIGRTRAGAPVKITAARDLTFENIAKECAARKGIQIAGIVDCGSPAVMREIDGLVEVGEMVELPEGGLRYRDATTILLGCELETVEDDGAVSHHISYFPMREQLRAFVGLLHRLVTNLELSSQRCRAPARKLLRMAHAAGGVFVPAHAFTPHRSPYGSCVARLAEMFGEEGIAQLAAVELGLSADSYLADRIAELAPLTLLSNSDAHSLPRMRGSTTSSRSRTPTSKRCSGRCGGSEGARCWQTMGSTPAWANTTAPSAPSARSSPGCPLPCSPVPCVGTGTS